MVCSMINTEYARSLPHRRPSIAAKCRSACGTIVTWLTLLLIGILAIPTLLFIALIGTLWKLADITIRAIDSCI